MKKAEIILAILSIMAIVMDLLFIPGGTTLCLISLFTLSGMYMYFSFVLFNGIPLRNIFKSESYKGTTPVRIVGTVLTGFPLALTIVGILFKILNWTGAQQNLSIGLVGLLIAVVVGLIRFMKSRSVTYLRLFARVFVVGGFGLILFLIPDTTWTQMKFRNYPGYVEARKNLSADPGNKELQEKVDEEFNKIYADQQEK